MSDNSLHIRTMRRLRGLPALVLTAAALALLSANVTSCNTQGCNENRSALPLMGFYSSTTGGSVMLDSLAIGGVDAPDDSLLLKPGERTPSLYIPFRADRQVTQYYFHYAYPSQGLDNPALNDTLTFRYTSTPYFASEECGAYYVYTLTSFRYTRHLIDSVAIVDSVFTNVEMERIKVFFRTVETGGGETPEEPGETPDEPGDTPEQPGDNQDEPIDTPTADPQERRAAV